MRKTLMIAAALLTLGVGSAFAAVPAPTQAGPTQVQASDDSGIYVANTPRHEISVYGAFSYPGTAQGGEG